MLVLEDLVGLHRIVQLQLLQHYWSGHRLGLLWYWIICLGNEQRSFCHFWDCIQVLQFGFPGGSDGKASACNVGAPSLIPGLGRSPGEGNGNPLQDSRTPVLLPRKFHGWRTLVGYSLWDRKESDTTERLFTFTSLHCILDSFFDHDGYSISSKGFLPTVVDIMVIWVNLAHSSPFYFADS